MSSQELHDLLGKLKVERESGDLVDSEYKQLLDELIESLEQQKLYPDAFDQYSNLGDQIQQLLEEFESRHPAAQIVLNGIKQVLQNFKS